MLSKLMNESIDSLFPPKVDSDKKEQKTVSLTKSQADQEYVDQEKLVKLPADSEEKKVRDYVK